MRIQFESNPMDTTNVHFNVRGNSVEISDELWLNVYLCIFLTFIIFAEIHYLYKLVKIVHNNRGQLSVLPL